MFIDTTHHLSRATGIQTVRETAFLVAFVSYMAVVIVALAVVLA